jgi:transposase-like protein
VLTDEDRAELAHWLEGGRPWLAERARIVLACAEPGSGVARVAAELGSTRMTVRKWRRRFAEEGLAGLADHDRPGRPVAELVLTGGERDQLTRWARRAKSSQALALRAKIVLACAAGVTNKQAAAADGGYSVWPLRMTVPDRAPVLSGGPIVISILEKSCGSTALVMEKVPLPLSGTRNVPAEATCRCWVLTYQHWYNFASPKFLR